MKKVFVFGNENCADCQVMKQRLTEEKIRFSFIDILDSLGKLKMFLKYRDTLAEFKAVREAGSVGIPFLLVNDGEWLSLDPPSDELIARLKE
jgi:glutaredoxin-related protein